MGSSHRDKELLNRHTAAARLCLFARFVASCGRCADESPSRLTTTTPPLSNRQKVPLSVRRHTKAGIEQRWVGHEQGRTEGWVSEDGTKKTPSDCGWLFQSLAPSRPSNPTHQPFRRDLSGGFSPVTQAPLSLSERWCPSGASTPLSPMWPCYFWGCRPSRVVMKIVQRCQRNGRKERKMRCNNGKEKEKKWKISP